MIPEIVFIFGTLGSSLFGHKITHNQASQIIEGRKNDIKELISQRNQEEQSEEQPEKEEEGEEEGEEEIETIIEEEPSLPYEFAREEEKPELLTLKGYFRSRFFFYSGIPEVKVKKHEDQNLELKYKNPFYIQSRLRLDPHFNISPTLRLVGQVDVFDDIVWGEGVSGFTPGEILCENYNEGNNFAECKGIPRIFAVKRFWGEIDSILTLPLSVSIGRQPVHYGLGIFFNDGNWFRNLWGDAHFGSTRDRLKLGVKVSDSFKVDTGFDFLLSELGETRENLVNPFLVPSFVSDKFSASLYGGAVYSSSKQTEYYFLLPYISLTPWTGFSFEAEANIISGNIGKDLIPILDSFRRYSIFALNFAGRIKYETGLLKLMLDGGWASGDDNPKDNKIKSWTFHPDYNAGFILFEDIIARYTGQGIAARIDNIFKKGGEFFGTKGGVSGAWFLMPTFGLFPFEAVGTYLSVLLAFSNQNTLIDPISGNPLFGREAKKGLLGVEIDWGVRIGTENFEFGTQLGYLILGRALRDALPEKKNTFKAQLRFTYLF
jgi:hypothetical protein